MHKAWSSIEGVPYCFFKVIHQILWLHGTKITNFVPNWAFLNCNSSFDWMMVMKRCTQLKVAKNRCHNVFEGDPSNIKVTRDKKIGRFPTVTPVWFHNDFEIMRKAWCGAEEVPYCISRSSIKFYGHTGQKIDDLHPIWVRLLGRLQLSNLNFPNQLVVKTWMMLVIKLFCLMWMLLINIKVSNWLECMQH